MTISASCAASCPAATSSTNSGPQPIILAIPISIEAGVGVGLTPATDDLAVKLMFSSDLTGPHGLVQPLKRVNR